MNLDTQISQHFKSNKIDIKEKATEIFAAAMILTGYAQGVYDFHKKQANYCLSTNSEKILDHEKLIPELAPKLLERLIVESTHSNDFEKRVNSICKQYNTYFGQKFTEKLRAQLQYPKV